MERFESIGPVVLRVALGLVFLAHSAYLKLAIFSMAGTVGFFESLGLPAISAYAVVAAEIAGGLMLIAGIRVREVALVLAVVAFGATWVHSGAGWLFTNEGGGYEYPLFLGVVCIAQALIGPGDLRSHLPVARQTTSARPAA